MRVLRGQRDAAIGYRAHRDARAVVQHRNREARGVVIARTIRGGDADLNRQRVVRVGRDRVAERRQLGKGVGTVAVVHDGPTSVIGRQRVRGRIPASQWRSQGDGAGIARAVIGAEGAGQSDHSSRRRQVVEL